MNLLENWKNLIEKARKLDIKSLESIRFAFFGAIVVNLFGIYWYLGLKKLGIALLVVLIMGLTLVLLLERGLPQPQKKTIKKTKREDKKMTEESQEVEQELQEPETDNFDTGLPNAKEFQERAKEAMGSLEDFGFP